MRGEAVCELALPVSAAALAVEAAKIDTGAFAAAPLRSRLCIEDSYRAARVSKRRKNKRNS